MSNYLLQKSKEIPSGWVCTDTKNKIVCVFEEHRFNETQKATVLEDFNPDNFMLLAKYMREMGDWLFTNHYNKIF